MNAANIVTEVFLTRIQRALLLKHAAALRMISWHLRTSGREESGKSPGNEKAGDGLSHTWEESIIYERMKELKSFSCSNCIFTLQPQCTTCCIFFFHASQFGPVFARGTEIRVETWGKSHPGV